MSGIVAFFGHRDVDVSSTLENKLEDVVRDLIVCGYDEFWCCEQGNFDWISRLVLRRLKQTYPNICLCMVCAYNPDKYSRLRQDFLLENYEVIYPEEAAKGTLRFAIARRNKFIAENADVVVCYITHHSGGAYQAVKIAEKCGKQIINLA